MDKEMTLEEAFGELDEMIKKLEDRSISLEDSFQEYDKGMKLLKYCNDKIDKATSNENRKKFNAPWAYRRRRPSARRRTWAACARP